MATTSTGLGTPKGMTRRRAETRRRVMAAAYEVFTELGIRDAPVELICERAGFTRGAFYSNFASKEALFLAIYEVEMRERAERLRVAVEEAAGRATPGSVDEVLQEAGLLFMASLAADETWYLLNAEFRAQAMRQPELREPTASAEGRFHDALAGILQNLLARLDLRLAVDPRSAVVTIVALYETMLERAILDELPDRADSRYLTDVLPRLFTALVAPGDEG